MNSHKSIESQILTEIKARGRGSVFVPTDFLNFGSREAIDLALHRLVQKGTIRRLTRGMYDFPKVHKTLGQLMPSAEAVASALAGRDRIRIQPAGAYASNLLGLSEQVPAKIVFLTDGPSRAINIDSMTIQLRRTTAKNMETAGRLSGLLIQAFKELGKENITTSRREHLRRTIPAKKRHEILKDIRFAPEWMRPILQDLAE